jgi:hypothetical protein
MEHIKTEHSNFVYRGPEPGIGDLHCERRQVDGLGRSAIFSTWKLTDEERAAVAAGANIELGIWYVEPIPPVSMAVTTRGSEVPK